MALKPFDAQPGVVAQRASFSDDLRNTTDQIWQRMFTHPFLEGLSKGTLPVERFKYYVRQDYIYLIEYSRARALAVAKAPPGPLMNQLALMLNQILNGEMLLHRSLSAKLGITENDLARTAISPTCHGYTRHLVSVAYSGTVAEYLASILPCAWGYREIGVMLAARPLPAVDIYEEWIRFYASERYLEAVAWARDELDRLAGQAGEDELERARQHYVTSARYEYMFWDAAFRLEEWAV